MTLRSRNPSTTTSSGFSSASDSYSLYSPQISREHDHVQHDFANVEDMLFEVFRCEETDSIDSISITQFLKVFITYTWSPAFTSSLDS